MLVLAAGAAACLAPAASGLERAVPLPPGTPSLAEPRQVQMGAATLDVQGFVTEMAPDAVRAFYEQALPRAGWRLGTLPWQANQTAAIKQLEAQLTQLPADAPQAQEMRAYLEELRGTERAMRQQLYVSRGGEHAIFQFMAMGGGTSVFINRWSGDSSWLESRSSAAGGRASGWPQQNVCCSGEAIPEAGVQLPSSVARYPGAKAIASHRPHGSDDSTVLFLTPDGTEAVASFYRKRMAYNGWTLTKESRGAEGDDRRRLVFRGRTQLCVVTLSGGQQDDDGRPAQTLIMVMVMPPLPQAGGAS